MESKRTSYFSHRVEASVGSGSDYQSTLDRVVSRLRDALPVHGLRNPRIGLNSRTWSYCAPGYDWVMGFLSGQLWLAAQLTGDPTFQLAARARRPQFQWVLDHREGQDHDIGFLFSLHSVADWRMTSAEEPRKMALEAARILLGRYREDGQFLQAWSPVGPHDRDQARFANGRMIVDTMQNLALLYWAHKETGRADFLEVAEGHASTTARHLVRDDGSSYHTYVFDPASGEPLRGETHQGHADNSCWSRGQAWLIHGFAQSYKATGNTHWLSTARKLAAKAEELMGDSPVPVWDFSLPADGSHPIDSSAGAVLAAGLFLLADQCEATDGQRWRDFGMRCLDGLIATCDLTHDPAATGLLAHGAAFVSEGRCDTMLPYGDYYFMEALMRALGHKEFFW